MPEANITSQMSNSIPAPVVPVVTSESSATKITMPAKTGFNKKFLMIPALLVIAALAAGAVWYFIFNKVPTQDTNPLPVTEQDEPKSNPEVTTPGDWLSKYFKSETCTEINVCGDKSDPDKDGLDNRGEYDSATDPNNADSDADGLADGDEKSIFGSDPLLARSYRDGEYNDADFAKGGYDINTNLPFAPDKLTAIQASIKEKGLHQPTLTTLGEAAVTLYAFSDPNNPILPLPNVPQTPEAKLDRDTQRQTTIQKVGVALVKYKTMAKSYPPDPTFTTMVEMIRPYNTVATNYTDPINVNQYVYGYMPSTDFKDFVLTYFSETQNQLIKYKASDAEAALAKESSQANDEQRKTDLESVRSALMVYSNTKLEPNSDKIYIFPATDQYLTELAKYFSSGIPKDPISKQDYSYEAGPNLDTFTLKTTLQSPAAGTTGYMCNQEECKNY